MDSHTLCSSGPGVKNHGVTIRAASVCGALNSRSVESKSYFHYHRNMVRPAVLCKFLAALALVTVFFGCTTSGTSPGEESALDRWLLGSPEASATEESLPERDETPPPQVDLESLQANQAPLTALTDLPGPDYYSFELKRPTYVNVTASSAAGAAIALIDRSVGEFARDGYAGQADGHIDALLDAGEYRVRVQTSGADSATISVTQFSEIEEDPEILMNTAPGTLHASSLSYYDQRSFWVRVDAGEPLILEALGRSLRAVRIWKDGAWVTATQPQVTEYSPISGQPMGYAQFSEQLPAGDYLLTFYGGLSRTWEVETGETPFFIRYGAKRLGSVVDAQTEISAMGRDAFLVSGDVTVVEVENSDFVPVRLGISRYGVGQDRYRAIQSASISRSDESTRSRGTVSRSSSLRWLFVAGTPGDTVRIRAIPQRTEYVIEEPTQSSQYLISTVSTLDSDHAIDVTPLIMREGILDSRDEVIRSDSLGVSQAPLVREINLFSPIFFLADLDRSGEWGLVHDSGEDSPVVVSMVPLREIDTIETPQVTTENPASFDLEAGPHMVMVQPSRPGVFRFALYYRGLAPAGNDRRAAALLESEAPAPRQDMTYITARNEITARRDHAVVINERGGPQSALFVERLPLTLNEGVPLTLAPGEELTLPIAPTTSGSLSVGYSTIEIRRNGGRIIEGGTIPSGRATLVVTNTSAATSTFVLRLEPHFFASFSAPPIPALQESLPILRPGPALYHDYERNQSREFLLIVDEPGFYELETTGRLAMRISTRTQVNPRGFTASSNGAGRNALVQTFFRPGAYLVEVRPEGNSAGRAGLLMAPLLLDDLGRMQEGAWYRRELDPGVGLVGSVGVEEAGFYSFRTVGLFGGVTTRIEDGDAWPVESGFLAPGAYRYYSWPQSVWNRRLTTYSRQGEAAEFAGDAPWPLALSGSRRRIWNETPNRTPHHYIADSPAALPVTLRTSSQMEWWVIDTDESRVFEGEGVASFVLPAGANSIFVRSKEENNNVNYEIALSTEVLADGLARQVQRLPSDMKVIVGEPGIYEFWSTGTWDVRASLLFGDLELASGDDRPGDWNFHISRYLPEGEYLLHVAESFPGSGTVTIAAQRRDEVWSDAQTLPLETTLQLDQTIVGIPFTSTLDAPLRITADSSAVELALYCDEVLVAQGHDSLFVPLHGGHDYLLRVRNESIVPAQVGIQLEVANANRIEWSGRDVIELPVGATVVTNPSGISVVEPSQQQTALLSSAPEEAARLLGGGVLASSGGLLWGWNDGDSPVPLAPLTLEPGRVRVFDITDDDVSAWVSPSPGVVSLVEARTVAGYLGLQTAGRLPAARDWSAGDMELSSTLLGLVGEDLHQVWLWDGAPSEGRRVELSTREYLIDDPVTVTDLETLTLQPGRAIQVATQSEAIEILLSPDVVAFAANGKKTLRTVAARGANRAATLPGGSTLFLVNTGNAERTARVGAAVARATSTITRASGAEAMQSAPGLFAARVEPGIGDSVVAVWAVDPTEIVLLTDSGRRIPARPPEALPYWSLPGIPGELRVTAGKGPVAAWLEYQGRTTAQWASRGALIRAALSVGENPMASASQRWGFQLDRTAFVMVSTENRGITILTPGGEQSDLPPQLRIGEGTERRVFAVLGPGSHEVVTRPLAGEPQPAPLRLQVLDPIPVSEAIEPDAVFLAGGERVVFSIDVTDEVPVGIGLQSESDDFVTYLLDDQLGVVGSGRLYYRELSVGRYYLLAENGSRPMNVVPVVIADRGSRTGVPEPVIESYREN